MKLPSPLIGILGGMGPQAGLDMAEKLIALTNTKRDQDHIPFVLFSLPETVPDRTAFLLGHSTDNPAHAIADQFEKMSEMGVTIAIMACNTAHAKPIFDVALSLLRERNVDLHILHLIQETLTHISKHHPDVRRIGVLATQGTYQAGLYDEAIAEAGLEVVLPEPDIRLNHIHAALYDPSFGIKSTAGSVSEVARQRIRDAIDHLHKKGAEAIVLGCTELPLAITEQYLKDMPILDPARIAAKKLIEVTHPERLTSTD